MKYLKTILSWLGKPFFAMYYTMLKDADHSLVYGYILSIVLTCWILSLFITVTVQEKILVSALMTGIFVMYAVAKASSVFTERVHRYIKTYAKELEKENKSYVLKLTELNKLTIEAFKNVDGSNQRIIEGLVKFIDYTEELVSASKELNINVMHLNSLTSVIIKQTERKQNEK